MGRIYHRQAGKQEHESSHNDKNNTQAVSDNTTLVAVATMPSHSAAVGGAIVINHRTKTSVQPCSLPASTLSAMGEYDFCSSPSDDEQQVHQPHWKEKKRSRSYKGQTRTDTHRRVDLSNKTSHSHKQKKQHKQQLHHTPAAAALPSPPATPRIVMRRHTEDAQESGSTKSSILETPTQILNREQDDDDDDAAPCLLPVKYLYPPVLNKTHRKRKNRQYKAEVVLTRTRQPIGGGGKEREATDWIENDSEDAADGGAPTRSLDKQTNSARDIVPASPSGVSIRSLCWMRNTTSEKYGKRFNSPQETDPSQLQQDGDHKSSSDNDNAMSEQERQKKHERQRRIDNYRVLAGPASARLCVVEQRVRLHAAQEEVTNVDSVRDTDVSVSRRTPPVQHLIAIHRYQRPHIPLSSLSRLPMINSNDTSRPDNAATASSRSLFPVVSCLPPNAVSQSLRDAAVPPASSLSKLPV